MSTTKSAAAQLLLSPHLPRAIAATLPPETKRHVDQLRALIALALESQINEGPILSTGMALRDYLFAKQAMLTVECFRVLFLDSRNMLIADELQSWGSITSANVSTGRVVQRALELGAASIILVHNHPSGNPQPSKADIELTRQIVRAGKYLDIVVHDHIIVAREGASSMRAAGLL